MSVASVVRTSEVADSLAALRRSTAHWLSREHDRTRLGSGISELDGVLAGGWPQGRLSEIVSVASAGASGIATATVAAATRRGEVVAWIDAADALDPAAVRAAGVELERVLWVRPRGVGEAVRAAELILDTGGFCLVVLDLAAGGAAVAGRRRSAGSRGRRGGNRVTAPSGERWGHEKRVLPLRLVRAVERAAVVLLVLTCHSWAGTLAGVTVALERGGALWGGERRGGPRWLVGFRTSVQLDRGASGTRCRRATLHFTTDAGGWAPIFADEAPEKPGGSAGMVFPKRWPGLETEGGSPHVVPLPASRTAARMWAG